MLRVIVCSDLDLSAELRPTVVGRGNIDRFEAKRIEEIRLLSAAVSPQAILVDRDMVDARELIEALRKEPTTRRRSVVVLAQGKPQPLEQQLLAAGANAVLRLPPDREWDQRLARLLEVAGRQDTRLEVQFAVDARAAGDETDGDSSAQALNLSPTGMALQTELSLAVGQEIVFRLQLPGDEEVAGRGRVARKAGHKTFGVEFANLDGASQQAIRSYLRSVELERGTG